jgi:hypothetical protein
MTMTMMMTMMMMATLIEEEADFLAIYSTLINSST